MFGPTAPTLDRSRRERLEKDREVVTELFAKMKYFILAGDGSAYAEGPIVLNVGAGYIEEIEVRLEFPPEYPAVPFRAFDAAHRWKPDPNRHIEADGKFCLWLANVDEPTISSAGELRYELMRLPAFLMDQFRFDDTDKWPTPDWRHGAAGYAQHVIERLSPRDPDALLALWEPMMGKPLDANGPCPCGSRRRFRKCHGPSVAALRWITTRPDAGEIRVAAMEMLDE